MKIEHTTYNQARQGHPGVLEPDPAMEEERRKSYWTGQRLYGSQNTGARHNSQLGNQAGERLTMWPTEPQYMSQAASSRVPIDAKKDKETEELRSTGVDAGRRRGDKRGVGRVNTMSRTWHYNPEIKPSRTLSEDRNFERQRRKPNLVDKIRNTLRISFCEKEKERSREDRKGRDGREKGSVREKKHSMDKIKRHRKAIDEGALEKVVPPENGVVMERRVPIRETGEGRRDKVREQSPRRSSRSHSHSHSKRRHRSKSRSKGRTRKIEKPKDRRSPAPDLGPHAKESEELYTHPRANWKGIDKLAPYNYQTPPSTSRSRSRSNGRLSPNFHIRDESCRREERLSPSPSPHRGRTSHDSSRSGHTRIADYMSSGVEAIDETRRKISSQFREPFEFISYPIFHTRHSQSLSSSSTASFYCRGEDIEADSMRVVVGGEGETLWEGKQLMECRFCKKRAALAGGLCRRCQKNVVMEERRAEEWTSRVDSEEDIERDDGLAQPIPRRSSTHGVLINHRSEETLAMWKEEERKATEEFDSLTKPHPPIR